MHAFYIVLDNLINIEKRRERDAANRSIKVWFLWPSREKNPSESLRYGTLWIVSEIPISCETPMNDTLACRLIGTSGSSDWSTTSSFRGRSFGRLKPHSFLSQVRSRMVISVDTACSRIVQFGVGSVLIRGYNQAWHPLSAWFHLQWPVDQAIVL